MDRGEVSDVDHSNNKQIYLLDEDKVSTGTEGHTMLEAGPTMEEGQNAIMDEGWDQAVSAAAYDPNQSYDWLVKRNSGYKWRNGRDGRFKLPIFDSIDTPIASPASSTEEKTFVSVLVLERLGGRLPRFVPMDAFKYVLDPHFSHAYPRFVLISQAEY